MRATQWIALAVVVAVVVAAVAVFTGAISPSSAPPTGNYLANGGFDSGKLNGWSTGNLVPSLESTLVESGAYAARFQTTSNGNVLSECTQKGVDCSEVNSSTISQDVAGFSVTANSTLSIAIYPVFHAPSIFQVTLDIAPALPGPPDTDLYYIFSASSQQCDAYSQLLVNGSSYAAAYCLSPPQGQWTIVTRNISSDLPTSLKPSDLGPSLTLSLSFAGSSVNDTAYVDSVSLSQ